VFFFFAGLGLIFVKNYSEGIILIALSASILWLVYKIPLTQNIIPSFVFALRIWIITFAISPLFFIAIDFIVEKNSATSHKFLDWYGSIMFLYAVTTFLPALFGILILNVKSSNESYWVIKVLILIVALILMTIAAISISTHLNKITIWFWSIPICTIMLCLFLYKLPQQVFIRS
jgi:hypothetical protein